MTNREGWFFPEEPSQPVPAEPAPEQPQRVVRPPVPIESTTGRSLGIVAVVIVGVCAVLPTLIVMCGGPELQRRAH